MSLWGVKCPRQLLAIRCRDLRAHQTILPSDPSPGPAQTAGAIVDTSRAVGQMAGTPRLCKSQVLARRTILCFAAEQGGFTPLDPASRGVGVGRSGDLLLAGGADLAAPLLNFALAVLRLVFIRVWLTILV